MGLLNFPTSADGGVLIVILVNTAISFSIFKHVVLSILNVMGIRIASWEEYSIDSTVDMFECRGSPPETYMEEFRCRTPSIRFDSLCSCEHPEQKCSICQNEFEPDAEINCLSCGHFFHKLCLEKWLKYWRVTCPNCRTCMMPQEEEDTCPM